MKRILLTSLMALGLSALPVQACLVSGVVSCPGPNGKSKENIRLYVTGVGEAFTSANGAYMLELPGPGTYNLCVDESTLPDNASLVGNNCTKITVDYSGQEFADENFTLKGPFCEEQQPGPCWLTGGGTIYKAQGKPSYSFGGVVNPGCSATAAGGGNWNVVDHINGLHFKGIDMSVISCSPPGTRSPKVNVSIIDFMGTGLIEGASGNPLPVTPVTFYARAVDNSEPGAGKDQFYLVVLDAQTSEFRLVISGNLAPGTLPPDGGGSWVPTLVTISTGNLQIHTSSCQ